MRNATVHHYAADADWRGRAAMPPPPELSERETIAMSRKSTWTRVGFALLTAALSAAFLDWRWVALWGGFALVWETAARPFLEERLVLRAGEASRPHLRLAAIHAAGSSAYCVLPVLLWQTQQSLAMVLAATWIYVSANHAFVYFAGRRSLLIACLAPLIACVLLALLATQQGFTPVGIVSVMAIVAFVAGTGIWGFDRRVLMRTFSDKLHADDTAQTRTQFLSTMSHELRTPLNAVIGYAELIEEESGAAPIAADARHIREAAQRLLGLINTVLDLSRLEAGGSPLSLERCEASGVLSEVAQRAAPLAAAGKNTFEVDAPERLGTLVTDPDRLAQCLMQVVSNACKFTESGRVTLSARRHDSDMLFIVSDTGPGVPEAAWEAIFEPFVQLDAGAARRHEGAGLGLALARQIARALGGDITCRSMPGQGATFTVRLPAGAL